MIGLSNGISAAWDSANYRHRRAVKQRSCLRIKVASLVVDIKRSGLTSATVFTRVFILVYLVFLVSITHSGTFEICVLSLPDEGAATRFSGLISVQVLGPPTIPTCMHPS